MNEPTRLNPLARRLLHGALYLLLGVLPAVGLALLGSLVVFSGQAASAWLMTIGAWAGALGLLSASVFPPHLAQPVRSCLISILLLAGELAMAPLSIGIVATGGMGVPLALLLVILGPTLLGLHYLIVSTRYLWRTRSPWRYLQLTSLLIAALALTAWLAFT